MVWQNIITIMSFKDGAMTLQQKKSRAFASALEEFEKFKAEWEMENPDATDEEYLEAISQKAEELNL